MVFEDVLFILCVPGNIHKYSKGGRNLEIPRVEGFKSQEFLKENESSNQKKLSKGGV